MVWFDIVPNGAGWVSLGLIVWLLSFVSLARLGPETVGTVLGMILGLIPALAAVTLVTLGLVELLADNGSGAFPWAVPSLCMAAVLAVLMSPIANSNPVRTYFVMFRQTGPNAVVIAAKETDNPPGALKLVLSALAASTAFSAAGGLGVWAGYQLAAGTTLLGLLATIPVAVVFTLSRVAKDASWNLVARGDQTLSWIAKADPD